MVWLLATTLAVAGAGDSALEGLFDIELDIPAAVYPGDVSAPPVPHFYTRLPAPKLGSGSHTERCSPVVFGDLILVGAAGSSVLHGVSRRDGSVVREYPADGPVQSTPVLLGDRVVFNDTGGTTWLYALDGDVVWRHEGTAPILTPPVVTPDAIIVADVEDLVMALDPGTGELLWRYQRPPNLSRGEALALFSSPTPAASGDLVYAGFSDGHVVALNKASGDPLWEVQVGEGEYPDLVAGLVTLGDDVYSSGYFAPFVAVDTDNESVRWRVEAGSAATPLLDTALEEPVLYHPGTDGSLRAVAARTGELLWTWESGDTGALTEIVQTPAGLLFGVANGGVYLVDPQSGDEVWRYHGDFQLNGVSSTPVVAGRQIAFVTNAGFLVSMLAPVERQRPVRRPWDSQHR